MAADAAPRTTQRTPLSIRSILLCASATHCAQVLHAAAAAHLPVYHLQPCTTWPPPTDSAAYSAHVVLWALLPPTQSAAEAAQESQWRRLLLHSTSATGWCIQMLYGNASQQAQQLLPWLQSSTPSQPRTVRLAAHCQECVDPASEQQLFQHLLQR